MSKPGVMQLPERSLAECITAAEQMLDLLQQERAAIEAADAVRLGQISRVRSAAMLRMALPPAAFRRIGPAVNTLRQVLRRCLQLGLENGALLEAQARRTQTTLSAMHGSESVYGSRGRNEAALSSAWRIRGVA